MTHAQCLKVLLPPPYFSNAMHSLVESLFGIFEAILAYNPLPSKDAFTFASSLWRGDLLAIVAANAMRSSNLERRLVCRLQVAVRIVIVANSKAFMCAATGP